MQRYIPAKSNNNSIIRVVWQRAPDEKHPTNTNAGGFFKVNSKVVIRAILVSNCNDLVSVLNNSKQHIVYTKILTKCGRVGLAGAICQNSA
jgi:hypothetical protein